MTQTLTSTGATTLSSAIATKTAGIVSSSDTSGSTGLSTSQKSIIGGVVGGIGGAILLGGLAVVAWRIWGRKKRAADEDDDLMGSVPGSAGQEKGNGVADSPFRSTLDQYHNPTGPVNASSNF